MHFGSEGHFGSPGQDANERELGISNKDMSSDVDAQNSEKPGNCWFCLAHLLVGFAVLWVLVFKDLQFLWDLIQEVAIWLKRHVLY